MGTITKALSLLNYFSLERSEIGLAVFVKMTGGDKATVRRHLMELEQNGFLEQNPSTRGYRLGPAVLRLADVRESSFPVRSVFETVVEKIALEIGELVHASLLQGEIMSPLCHADPEVHGVRVKFDGAELLPLHATASGLAVLGFGSPELRKRTLAGHLEAYTEHTTVQPTALEAMVSETNKNGYSVNEQGYVNDVISFAVPVFEADGLPFGTLAVAVPVSRMTPELKAIILQQLFAGARQVTVSFGGRLPERLALKWDKALERP